MDAEDCYDPYDLGTSGPGQYSFGVYTNPDNSEGIKVTLGTRADEVEDRLRRSWSTARRRGVRDLPVHVRPRPDMPDEKRHSRCASASEATVFGSMTTDRRATRPLPTLGVVRRPLRLALRTKREDLDAPRAKWDGAAVRFAEEAAPIRGAEPGALGFLSFPVA